MCGIAGYFSKSRHHNLDTYLQNAAVALSKRGPDLQQTSVLSSQVGFAHTRLSIIDTSELGNQPMTDASGRFTIIFNGEIFNYKEIKKKFFPGVSFVSNSDTEVLLNLYIRLGKDFLQQLNGFFAFAIYDNEKRQIFLARDRFGIKPLHFYTDNTMIVFASELKAIMSFPTHKEIDFDALTFYLQLNYVPGTNSILKKVQKLKPGYYAVIDDKGNLETERFYSISFTSGEKIPDNVFDYSEATAALRTLVEESVERRLVADVPLGTFLSGGIDSSIITTCAAKHVKHLNTFSVGYRDEPYFDETAYANLVAQKFNTNHTVFSVTSDEMYESIFSVLDYVDEPFADSSAIAVYLLSKKARKNITVALSGDGGDELFGGYNKHKAELRARENNLVNALVRAGLPVLKLFPKSRHSKITNFFRQLQRYSEGLNLTRRERYWHWCITTSQQNAFALLKNKTLVDETGMEKKRQFVLECINEDGDLNDILFADMQMVLSSDMLTKVDLMSMANGLEVRVPFLDFTLVDFVFSLPVSFKMDVSSGKKILKDAFVNDLPPELFNRAKHGFEVPLRKWMMTGLRQVVDDLLGKEFVEHQNIFNYNEIEKVKAKLYSRNSGDTHYLIWSLLVFQYWFKKYFSSHA